MPKVGNSMVAPPKASCSGRDERLDSVRSFCNVVLVVIHAYPFMYGNGRDWEFWFCNFVSMKLCIMILPTLFLISGYLFFVNLVDASSYGTKIKSRIKRLVVPYVAWNCLFALSYYVIGRFSPQAAGRLASFEGNNILGIPFSYVLGLSGMSRFMIG